MEKHLATIAAVAILALGSTACMQESSPPPGSYEKTTSTTDASGTKYKTKTSTDVTVDDEGDKTIVTKSKTTKDPKGLFNKSSTSSKEVVEEK